MNTFGKTFGAAAFALACSAAPGFAAQIPAMNFDIGGNLRADGGSSFDTATGLDFARAASPGSPSLTTYAPGNVPGDGGTFILRNPSTFLASLGFYDGLQGTAVDIPNGTLPAGSTSTPFAVNLPGFYSFTANGTTLAFSLSTIIDVVKTAATSSGVNAKIALDGTGTMSLTGYDSVTGSFSLSTTNNDTGGIQGFRASFNGSAAALPTSVPEPLSLALLASGLAGVGMIRARVRA